MAIRLLGCWFSFIIFCSLVVSDDDSNYAWSIVSARSSSTAGPSASSIPRSSSTWCSISQLIFNEGSLSSLEPCPFLFLNSSPIEESVSYWRVPLTAEPGSVSLLFWAWVSVAPLLLTLLEPESSSMLVGLAWREIASCSSSFLLMIFFNIVRQSLYKIIRHCFHITKNATYLHFTNGASEKRSVQRYQISIITPE